MKLSSRQSDILKLLKEQGYAKVEYLAHKTYISPSSIRRDLQYLESRGLVERDYGGVRLAGSERKNPPIQVRKGKDRVAKRSMARKAVKLVRNGQSVFLDSSTTSYYLVEHLAELRGVTVFTNNLETALHCIEKGLSVYVIGGRAIRGMPVLGGAYAEEMIEKITVDIAFLSSYGIDKNGVVTDTSEEENKMRKLMLKRANIRVLLLDGSKIGRSAPHVLCSVHDVEHFITDDEEAAKSYALSGR